MSDYRHIAISPYRHIAISQNLDLNSPLIFESLMIFLTYHYFKTYFRVRAQRTIMISIIHGQHGLLRHSVFVYAYSMEDREKVLVHWGFPYIALLVNFRIWIVSEEELES